MTISIQKDNILLICGASGYGKSYFLKYYMKKFLPYWVLWDETGEYRKEGIGYWCNTIPQLAENKRSPMLTYNTAIPSRQREMEKFCYVAWKLFHNRAVIFEECDLYFHPRGMPRYGWIIVFQGRHENMLRIFVSKRIHTVNPNIISNANFIVLFQVDHENDIRTLKVFMGKNHEEREANMEKLKSLKKYEYAIWDREARDLTVFPPLPRDLD